jgi:2-polyprenyl-3-methyl-5-hydroxy-6-metoxy-1,4-benzoquinol methylase
MHRSVQPELLDQLAHDDPGAIGSRRDLRRINALMSNHRWLCDAATKSKAGNALIELGAGDGILARKMAQTGNSVSALDFAPAPAALPINIEWIEGDFFDTLGACSGDTLVACLILHHFKNAELKRLGELIDRSGICRLLAAEPHRSQASLFLARTLCPFVNPVTRHDITVSVRAGFQVGELAAALNLSSDQWRIEESTTLLGAYRFQATRIAGR